MSKSPEFDLMIIGGGMAAAATALAAATGGAGRRKHKLSVAWVQTDPQRSGDLVAASYAFLNPAAGAVLPPLRTSLAKLTDGAFKGLDIVTAREGRHAQFLRRTICGYVCDGPKLLKGLTAMCQRARVKIIRPTAAASFLSDDHVVRAVWTDGQCAASLALLADMEIVHAGQAEKLGFRSTWLANRLYACVGQTFELSPARLNEMFGRTRRMTTVWQLECLDGDLSSQTSPAGHDGHAWVLPKGNSISVACMLGQPTLDRVVRDPASLMAAVLGELRAVNVLPADLGPAVTPVQTWMLPVGAALDVESHAGKRSLAVGLAGGFVSALSGQWLYPVIHAGVIASAVATKALADPRPQDVLSQYGARWRQKLSDYLRSPNTRLAFLLPLVFGNRQIADRFSKAYLFGENF